MYTFLVLGLVPGTNIQINFQTWLYGLGLLPLAYLVYCAVRLYLRHRPAGDELLPGRQTLHANQIHSRLTLLAR